MSDADAETHVIPSAAAAPGMQRTLPGEAPCSLISFDFAYPRVALCVMINDAGCYYLLFKKSAVLSHGRQLLFLPTVRSKMSSFW
jgi:hypothetical protein